MKNIRYKVAKIAEKYKRHALDELMEKSAKEESMLDMLTCFNRFAEEIVQLIETEGK